MEEFVLPIIICGMLFVALPWIIFHYITKWKTAATRNAGHKCERGKSGGRP